MILARSPTNNNQLSKRVLISRSGLIQQAYFHLQYPYMLPENRYSECYVVGEAVIPEHIRGTLPSLPHHISWRRGWPGGCDELLQGYNDTIVTLDKSECSFLNE